jgi:hypothetical protein
VRQALIPAGMLLSIAATFATPSGERTLTFEDRVKAQEAIERVYYSHQIGATDSFETAVPRAVLERKVHTYLDQTAALRRYWKTSITDEMLQGELERMARGTRMPERLHELYAALGNDPFLIKECLARAALVDRLARSFYASDPRFHAETRRRATELHRRLSRGELNPSSDHPSRSVYELVQSDGSPRKARCERVSPEEFRRRRALFPAAVGKVSALEEESDAFVLHVVLSETPHALRAASYVIPKTTWDAWWESASSELRNDSVAAVATERDPLPLLGPNAAPCAGSDTWDNGSSDSFLTGREKHSAVWTGTLMVVWGGSNTSGYLGSGGRYDPALDSWSSVSTAAAPSGRVFHTAVWTGRSMVVWGGISNDTGSASATGGRYDPITDAWTPTAVAGAASAREGHTAVWTGTKMLVWGGFGGALTTLNTGGRYDPASDSWAPMSVSGAPATRASHTAVWTGNEMVVWGGSNWSNGDCHDLNSGGRYNPASDSWLPTSETSAPSAREAHTALWTGSVMIVWAGQDEANNLNTGGRYDPASDSWLPTSETSAPAARVCSTAVWTGTLMIVWGGHAGNAANTGGRYDPATDSWSSTSSVDAPAPRYSHSAVWTGSAMIVWGGFGDSDLNSGGRYALGAAVDVCNGIDDNCNGLVDENGLGEDSDNDTIHNVCDNCVSDWNATQSDVDHDGQGDACDFDDGLILVSSPDKNHRQWQAESGYTAWNSYRGSLSVLRATGQYTQAPGSNPLAARDCGLADPHVLDPLEPGTGEVAFNLVTGVAGGVESDLGTNSAGVPRANANPCP